MVTAFSFSVLGSAVDEAVVATVPDDSDELVELDFAKPAELKRWMEVTGE